jgi:hypothetical protein
MKKQLSFIMILFSVGVLQVKAQWQPINSSGTDTGNIYHVNGNVGIGITTPQARLEVFNPGPLGTSLGNFLLLTRFSGAGNTNYFMNNTWLYRDANGSDWLTARLHNGISIDGSFLTPAVDTRTWWERAPFQDIQSFGTGSTSYLTIKGGNVGIGSTAPQALLHVATGSANAMAIFESTGSSNSCITVKNSVAQLNAGIGSTGSTNGYPYLWSSSGKFMIGNDGNPTLVINGMGNGNVGIGTTTLPEKLTVNGKIKCEEVQVVVDVPADYVFEKEYKLPSLQELGTYIQQNKHLPGVPNAQTLKTDGWNVGEMNNKLLEKIEELTLYMIELKKENEELKMRVNNIEADH